MNISITPWKRFGHDRLYVSVDDRKIGYRDNVTGLNHPEREGDAALLSALVDAHLAAPASHANPLVVSATDVATAVVPLSASVFGSDMTDHAKAAVVASVRRDNRPGSAPSVCVRQPTQVVAEEAWTDLALNKPGQMARERAVEEWETRKEQFPVRSRLGRLLNVHTDERAWRIGADGEEAVGAQLEKLARKDPRWRVLHAVPVGERGSDIDHMVIGPAGVFVINAKHHPGAKVWVGKDQLRVNGHVEPYIRNSRFEATRAAKLLTAATGIDVRVDALIVLYGVEDIAVKTEPGEKDGSSVHVKYRRQSIRWLTKQPAVLTDAQADAIYEQARRSIAWSRTSL